MIYDADELSIQVQEYGRDWRAKRQGEQLKAFSDLNSAMQRLWDSCEAIRMSPARPRKRYEVDPDQVHQIIDVCETGILAQVSESIRYELQMEASNRTLSHIGEWFGDLGDKALIAHSEVSLRVLMHLALETASNTYDSYIRLPIWGQAIRSVGSKTLETVEAWRMVV